MEGHIGVDESGKGDYFGPLVIAACYVGPEHLAELDGVKDSKKITDALALKLAGNIRRVCPHSVIAIGPARYNEMYQKTPNLNRLLAWGHAQCIQNVLENQPSRKAISDQFADPRYLRSLLERKELDIELVSMPRAEVDIAVAAASILARAEFLNRLAKLGDEVGMVLPKGATNVIGPGKHAVAKHGREVLTRIAKLHFKTTQQVLSS
jgi:ribonuclease HIII